MELHTCNDVHSYLIHVPGPCMWISVASRIKSWWQSFSVRVTEVSPVPSSRTMTFMELLLLSSLHSSRCSFLCVLKMGEAFYIWSCISQKCCSLVFGLLGPTGVGVYMWVLCKIWFVKNWMVDNTWQQPMRHYFVSRWNFLGVLFCRSVALKYSGKSKNLKSSHR